MNSQVFRWTAGTECQNTVERSVPSEGKKLLTANHCWRYHHHIPEKNKKGKWYTLTTSYFVRYPLRTSSLKKGAVGAVEEELPGEPR
jgi:hypothetical protein